MTALPLLRLPGAPPAEPFAPAGLRGRRIALVANTDFYLFNFRGGLIRELVDAGSEVMAIAPDGPYRREIEALGARFVPWDVSRQGAGPIENLRSVFRLLRIYRQLRPDVAHHFTIKANLYGTVAARLARVPAVVCTVTGLGYVFTEQEPRARRLRRLLRPLYRGALRLAGAVTLQNANDGAELGLTPDARVRYQPGGSGVDTHSFDPAAVSPVVVQRVRTELGAAPGQPLVVFVGRMLWQKGLGELIDAARILRHSRPRARFALVGPTDDNPGAIPKTDLEAWRREGAAVWSGPRRDIREVLAAADVVVLPSYREGTPRVLLEGAAMGRPLVATDIAGCREVVEHGRSGMLVPPRDAVALAFALRRVLVDHDLAAELGRAARQRAVARFDERQIIGAFFDIYRELLASRSRPATGGHSGRRDRSVGGRQFPGDAGEGFVGLSLP